MGVLVYNSFFNELASEMIMCMINSCSTRFGALQVTMRERASLAVYGRQKNGFMRMGMMKRKVLILQN